MGLSFSKRSRRFRAMVVTAPLLAGAGIVAFLFMPSSPPTGRARAQAPVDPNVLLLNGSFSEGEPQPDKWFLQVLPGTVADCTVDDEGARSAPRALRITISAGTNGNGRVTALQMLQRVPEKEFSVSGWSKTRDFTGTARLLVRAYDADGEEIASVPLPIVASDEWSEFSKTVTLPRGASRAVCAFEVVGKGTLWLDDIAATPVLAPTSQR